jgi:hypothetical protein
MILSAKGKRRTALTPEDPAWSRTRAFRIPIGFPSRGLGRDSVRYWSDLNTGRRGATQGDGSSKVQIKIITVLG